MPLISISFFLIQIFLIFFVVFGLYDKKDIKGTLIIIFFMCFMTFTITISFVLEYSVIFINNYEDQYYGS